MYASESCSDIYLPKTSYIKGIVIHKCPYMCSKVCYQHVPYGFMLFKMKLRRIEINPKVILRKCNGWTHGQQLKSLRVEKTLTIHLIHFIPFIVRLCSSWNMHDQWKRHLKRFVENFCTETITLQMFKKFTLVLFVYLCDLCYARHIVEFEMNRRR